MKIWLIANWTGIATGFLIGWIVFKRPAWAEAILAKIWAWIQSLFAALVAKIKSKV